MGGERGAWPGPGQGAGSGEPGRAGAGNGERELGTRERRAEPAPQGACEPEKGPCHWGNGRRRPGAL